MLYRDAQKRRSLKAMDCKGGLEILGAFAGRYSYMGLSEIEEACAELGMAIQGKELRERLSDLKGNGFLKIYGWGKDLEAIATEKGRMVYREHRSRLLERMSKDGKHPAAMMLVEKMLKGEGDSDE
jgi:hypothetical protein